jgi:hypothetical protein
VVTPVDGPDVEHSDVDDEEDEDEWDEEDEGSEDGATSPGDVGTERRGARSLALLAIAGVPST